MGEIAQAHDGSLGLAHAHIDAVADAGADAIKFQTHIAAAESTPAEPFRVRFSQQDRSRYEYWQRMEFSESQWQGLAEHARDRGLLFLSSPFSNEAVELLTRVGIAAWKVASGEITNVPLLERIAETGLPVILSTGMSDLTEIDQTVDRLLKRDVELAVLQCTSAYPCPPEKLGLNMIPELRERYGCTIGLSDHSGTIYSGLAAATLGIEVLEIHVALSREMFGPDVPSSVTSTELRQLVEGVRFIERAREHPVDKDAIAEETAPLRALFTKSLFAREDLAAGTMLREEHLAIKKPGIGISPERLPQVLGRRLRCDLRADELLKDADLEGND